MSACLNALRCFFKDRLIRYGHQKSVKQVPNKLSSEHWNLQKNCIAELKKTIFFRISKGGCTKLQHYKNKVLIIKFIVMAFCDSKTMGTKGMQTQFKYFPHFNSRWSTFVNIFSTAPEFALFWYHNGFLCWSGSPVESNILCIDASNWNRILITGSDQVLHFYYVPGHKIKGKKKKTHNCNTAQMKS